MKVNGEKLKKEVLDNKHRVSTLKGIVIARRNAGLNTTIRLRRMVAGVGVESVFPLYDFYILAEGLGNFNAKRGTHKFNMMDPPMRNIVASPVNDGRMVTRFVADNHRAWFKHCHLDVHITWGLEK